MEITHALASFSRLYLRRTHKDFGHPCLRRKPHWRGAPQEGFGLKLVARPARPARGCVYSCARNQALIRMGYLESEHCHRESAQQECKRLA